ncbi:hypothetical protein FisN_17Hh183 [Fistulifera solaris]|uniref:Beta-carotene isomerase D27-like C-terminal domain-containing protein n=1 Tax=Fistulifera solaris TaxID=1519565 RepID=A0A1Z5JH45_FISSO|nr:hypothetical protein FisN_17Hh183 [Fistulifera solaris]|eukprot:GAX13246.1 hypothetical protein FisN_17Hh183 [Fistulifera solaris]
MIRQRCSQWRMTTTCLAALILLADPSWSFQTLPPMTVYRIIAPSYRTSSLFESIQGNDSQESPASSISEKAALELAESATAAIDLADKIYTSSAWGSLFAEAEEVLECIGVAMGTLVQPDSSATVDTILKVCDDIDQLKVQEELLSRNLSLRRKVLEFRRYQLLGKLLRCDYNAYVATASFLSPSRIPRIQLPNVQDIPYKDAVKGDNVDAFVQVRSIREHGWSIEYEGGHPRAPRTGSEIHATRTAEAQHTMVKSTLGNLMTPVLPPFYRIFMSGFVPKLGTDMDGKQLGPWFYAPWLTSFVTPTFFGFLVGPSRPNLRKDGQLGGLIVEKCKFLQESGCKGLCLHQCKIPAQEFFQQELGLPLTVSPNFVTQECQWSFGETPLPVNEDPTFPAGCLAGCKSRDALVQATRNTNACSY